MLVQATYGRLPQDPSSCRDTVLVDLDGDSDLDLAFAEYRQELLYLNDGLGYFTDVTATHMVPNATSSWDLAAADVDGDGDVDLVLAEQYGHALLLNDGSAHFTDATAGRVPAANAQCLALALADVDGDGDQDLVSAYWQAPATLYLNDGTGTFADATAGNLSFSPDSTDDLVLGDVDGDGDLDLWFTGWFPRWTGGIALFENDGTGAFTDVTAAKVFARSTNPVRSLALADVDNDGDPDLVAPGYWSHGRLLRNDGAGVFADVMPGRLSAYMDVPWDLALADLDGDLDLDLVSANGFDDWTAWPNRLHRNDGYGSFHDVSATHLPEDYDDSRAVVAADVDQDGDLDLVFGNWMVQSRLYLNDGTAVFTDATAARMPPGAAATTSLAAGDVNGDGYPDLVVGNFLEQTRLYLNDGAGSLLDTTASSLPSAVHETRALALGDVSGDGHLDLVLAVGYTQGAQNRLYLNDGTGVFTDATATHMPAQAYATACLDLGDADGDGDLDIVFGNDVPGGFGRTNSLYVNGGNGVFTAGWLMYDLDNTEAIAFADVDEDGDLDVFCGDYGTYNKLYLNDGTGSYTDGTYRMPGVFENTRAIAVGDVDGDGDVDLLAGTFGSQHVETVLHLNHHRQLGAPRVAAIGETWVLDVDSRAGYATAPQAAVVLLGLSPASIALPPYGVLRVDPSSGVWLPAVQPAPTGRGSLALPLPPVTALAGLMLYAQALVLPTSSPAAARLTNALRERLNAF